MTEFDATVVSGLGEAEGFITLSWVTGQLREKLGCSPYPGTLNLQLSGDAARSWKELNENHPGIAITPPEGFCDSRCYPVKINGRVLAHIVRPLVPDYPPDKIELVSPHKLRRLLSLDDGDTLRLEPVAADKALSGPGPFDALLFDLEGTLVDFQWQLAAAEGELRRALEGLGLPVQSLQGLDYGTLRRCAYRELGMDVSSRKKVDARLSPIYDRYDLDALSRWSLRDGAAELLEKLERSGISCALVSNVGKKAVMGLLKKFGLVERFQTVVTRDDVVFMKPDGEGILRALVELDRPPGNALMVGDSLSDLMASRDAETPVALITGGESVQRPLGPWRPDYLVASFAEISDLVFWERALR